MMKLSLFKPQIVFFLRATAFHIGQISLKIMFWKCCNYFVFRAVAIYYVNSSITCRLHQIKYVFACQKLLLNFTMQLQFRKNGFKASFLQCEWKTVSHLRQPKLKYRSLPIEPHCHSKQVHVKLNKYPIQYWHTSSFRNGTLISNFKHTCTKSDKII